MRDSLAGLLGDMSTAIEAAVEGASPEAFEAAFQDAWATLRHYLPEAIQKSQRLQRAELDLTTAWNDYRGAPSSAGAPRQARAIRMRNEFELYCSAVLR